MVFAFLTWIAALSTTAQAIDPVRVGDQVEVYLSGSWVDGEVLDYEKKMVKVQHKGTFPGTKIVPLSVVRYPRGESEWLVWSDASGKFKIDARMVKRSEKSVTLLRVDGKQQTIPIDRLSPSSQARIKKYEKREQKLTDTAFVRVGDEVEVMHFFKWRPARVIGLEANGAQVRLEENNDNKGSKITAVYKDLRYPNGGGPWTTWKDSTGKFSLKARYLSHDDKNVYLLGEGNKKVTIDRSKLNTAAETELKRRPVYSIRSREVPFDLSSVDYESLPTWMGFNKGVPSLFESAFNIASSETVNRNESDSLASGFYKLNLPTSPAIGFPDESNKDQAKQQSDSRAGQNALNRAGIRSWAGGLGSRMGYKINVLQSDDPRLLLLELSPDKKSEYDALTLYWLDLNDPSVLLPGPSFFEGEKVLGYSVKQKRLLTVEFNGDYGSPTRFCSYSLEPKARRATSEITWAVPTISFAGSSPLTVAFLPSNKVSIGYGGKISIWDIENKRLLNACSSTENSQHWTSDGSFLSTLQFTERSVVDSQTLKPIFKIESTSSVFSQDGQYLWSGRFFSPNEIVDLATNKVVHQLTGREAVKSFEVLNNYWIISNSGLWSRERNIFAWSYNTKDLDSLWSGVVSGRIVQIAQGIAEPAKLYVAVHDVSAGNAKDEIYAVSDDDLYILRPGARVRMDASVSDAKILAGIRKAIVESGWIEDPASEIVIKAKVGPGKTVEMSYTTMHFGFGGRSGAKPQETFSVTPWQQGISIEHREVSVWGNIMGSVPSFVTVKQGQSIEQEVRKSEHSSYSLFENLKLPEKVLDPKYANGLGATTMTPDGLVEISVGTGQ